MNFVRENLTNFGRSRLECAYALMAIWGGLFAVFASWQHYKITSLVPEVEFLWAMAIGTGLLFLSSVTWSGIFRFLGVRTMVALAAGFLMAHALFAASALLPSFVLQMYLVSFGLAGLALTVRAALLNFSPSLILFCLAGIVALPLLWAPLGWLLFALPHSNNFHAFVADRLVHSSLLDLLHQRAYVHLIHNYGFPSVGINGLAYHNYHWLVGYTLSALAKFASSDVLQVHANMLPGFTGPVLLHGLFVGLIMAGRRVSVVLIGLGLLSGLYLAAVWSSPAISYGLVWITPSTAFSIGLSAPLLGLFLWYFNGNLSQLRASHFVVFAGFVLLVGLAKVSSVPQIGILVGTLWLTMVLKRKSWLVPAFVVSLLVAVSASVAIYFVWEASKHLALDGPLSSDYLNAFEALSFDAQSDLRDDVLVSLELMHTEALAVSTDYEGSVFHSSILGRTMIGLTVLLVASLFALPTLVRNRLYWSVAFTVVLTIAFVIQRSFFGFVTPTQVIYILLPSAILGVFGLSLAVDERIFYSRLRKVTKSGARWSTIIAAGFLVIIVAGTVTVHFQTTKFVRNAAAQTAMNTLGLLANPQGKGLVRQLTGQRVSSFGLVLGEVAWPQQASRYWETWDNRPYYVVAQDLLELVKRIPDKQVAIFVPASSRFWSGNASSDSRNSMYWLQGSVGVPLYRGKLNLTGDFNKAFRGRGASDFANDSAAVISDSANIFCWDRFKGYQIVSLRGETLKTC